MVKGLWDGRVTMLTGVVHTLQPVIWKVLATMETMAVIQCLIKSEGKIHLVPKFTIYSTLFGLPIQCYRAKEYILTMVYFLQCLLIILGYPQL